MGYDITCIILSLEVLPEYLLALNPAAVVLVYLGWEMVLESILEALSEEGCYFYELVSMEEVFGVEEKNENEKEKEK